MAEGAEALTSNRPEPKSALLHVRTHGTISGLSLCFSEPQFPPRSGSNKADLVGRSEDIVGGARSPGWHVAGDQLTVAGALVLSVSVTGRGQLWRGPWLRRA